MRLSCGPLIDVMEAPEHGYCDDLSSLGVSMRRKWHRRAGCSLSNRTVWAPAVERSLKVNTWSRHSVLTDLTLARGHLNGVRAWVIPR
jgi:hypothetical protein